MKRLTKYLASGAAGYNYPADCYGGNDCNARVAKSAYRQTCVDRLAAYEDTGLTPEEIEAMQHTLSEYHKVADPLLRAQADGRLVVLPCKVGDTVYRIFNPPSREPVISAHTLMSVDYIVRWIDKFGKTVFLTREEAENALEPM